MVHLPHKGPLHEDQLCMHDLPPPVFMQRNRQNILWYTNSLKQVPQAQQRETLLSPEPI